MSFTQQARQCTEQITSSGDLGLSRKCATGSIGQRSDSAGRFIMASLVVWLTVGLAFAQVYATYATASSASLYLTYQPSGEWGEQLVQLLNMAAVAKSCGRVLVVPPAVSGTFDFESWKQIYPIILSDELFSEEVMWRHGFELNTAHSCPSQRNIDERWPPADRVVTCWGSSVPNAKV